MGFEHWIMNNFWPVAGTSLVVLAAAHFAVVALLRKGGKSTAHQEEKDGHA